MGGVPFSLLAWIPLEAKSAHRFHRKSPSMAKMAQNILKKGGTPLCTRFLSCPSINFFLVPTQGPKRCYFNPKMGAVLK